MRTANGTSVTRVDVFGVTLGIDTHAAALIGRHSAAISAKPFSTLVEPSEVRPLEAVDDLAHA